MKQMGMKGEIRSLLEAELGTDVRVEFVEDGNRLDVRVADLGVADELESRFDDVTVNKYSEYRFTVMRE